MNWMNGPTGGDGMGPGMMQQGMGMCKEMMDSSVYATPEIRALFEDWALEVERQIIESLATENVVDIKKMSEEIGIGISSLFFFLTRLANKGRIRVQDVTVELVDQE